MPIYDDLTVGLRYPMFSATSPAHTQVRQDSDKPTDQLMNTPPDGDTKSADPESWVTDQDFNRDQRVARKQIMQLPGTRMMVMLVNDSEMETPIMNFIDHDIVPPGEIWIRSSDYASVKANQDLLREIIYCFLVWRESYARDKAKLVANSIAKAMGSGNRR